MLSLKTTAASALALISLVQMCPAPGVVAAVAGAAISGAVSGAVGAAVHRRDVGALMGRDLPPGISQHSIDQCVNQIDAQFKTKDLPVTVSSTGPDSARADNVPPACMDLATVLLKTPTQAGGPVPTPLGSSSLEYTGLSPQDKNNLQQALDANKH